MYTKKDLRKEFQEKRNKLSQQEIIAFSLSIFELLEKEFDFQNKIISIFLPIEKKNEINTYEFINRNCLNSIITAPVADFESSTLKHIKLSNLNEQIEINQFGIPEPKFGEEINVKNIDFVIVPLLTFDKNGYRVGYGKGFYDRFLQECKKECLFIGVNFFEAIEKIDDLNEFDVPLDLAITPSKIYFFI